MRYYWRDIKEGDINEELIDKMVQISGKYCSFG